MWQMHMQMMGFSFPIYWFFFIFIFSVPLIIVLFYFISTKETSERANIKTRYHYVFPLTDEEKRVVEFLKNNNDRSTQKEIQTNFNFSKVKTYRILRNLESKGVILKVKRG